MNNARALSRLHVLRSLSNYLDTRWGLGLLYVDPTSPGETFTASSENEWSRYLGYVDQVDEAMKVHREALLALPRPGTGQVWNHPAGFQALMIPCAMSGKVGHLLAGPMIRKSESSKRREDVAAHLVSLDLDGETAEGFSARIPALDSQGISAVSELLGLMSTEASAYADHWAISERRLDHLRKKHRKRYQRLIGNSLTMQGLYSLLDKVAGTESTVYIHGENGTGKELVAREIHEHSPRVNQPFVIQNCSALNDNLLESELFGHVRGAFTGAVQDKKGLFERADQGTFFLDEIGDMSPALQVKLLRVLQEGTFTPVGGVEVRRVDVRVLCATNRDLRSMVKEGTFREDLFYRINVISLEVPPLRNRMDDIPLLTEHFVVKALQRVGNPDGRKRLSTDAMRRLQEYHWPGNVRELENEIERLVVLTGPLITTIGQDLLSAHIRTQRLRVDAANGTVGGSLPDALERLERTMLYEQLKACRWNKTKAAGILGISRRNLIRKVAKYGFERRDSADHPNQD